MKDYRVEFNVTPPIEATDEQVEQWIEFCLGYRAEISLSNPLSEYDLYGATCLNIS